jgi:hypothetical protein
MKARHFIAPGILGIAICGAAGARSIVYDSGQWDSSATFPGSITGSSGTLTVDGTFLALMPGGTFTVATPPAVPFVTGVNNSFPPASAYEFNWGTDATNSDSSSNGILEQVIVNVTSPTAFTVEFNYASTGCSKETASLSFGGTTYSAADPCSANLKPTGNEFSVVNGIVSGSLPSGWSSSAAVSAPEIDSSSALSGLALLFGSLAVARGRRASPQTANHA